MQSAGETVAVSKKTMWIGYIVAAPPVLLLLMSAVMKLMQPPSLVEGFIKAGYPAHLIVPGHRRAGLHDPLPYPHD